MNFMTGAAVKLVRSGQPDIRATNVVVKSARMVTCTLDLTGAAVGLWSVIVTNPGGESATLPNAFKVESPTLEIIGPVQNFPNPFDPAKGPTIIKYTLSRDVAVTVYVYNIKAERVWEYNAPAGSPGGRVGGNEVPWDGITAFKAYAASGVYILHVTTRDKGGTQILAKTKIAIIK